MSLYSEKSRVTSPFGPKSHFRFPTAEAVTIDKMANNQVVSRRDGVVFRNLQGVQVTGSEGHQWPIKDTDLNDSGGPFYTRKVYIADMSHRKVSGTYNQSTRLETRFMDDVLSPISIPKFQFASNGDVVSFPDRSSSTEDLEVLGTMAIAACSPVTPVASLPTMIGELVRDGLPTIMGLKTLKGKGKPSSVGDEYLNYQFGIKPLVNDLKSLYTSLSKADKLIAQLHRDSGKVVRRRMSFPTERSVLTNNVLLNRTAVANFANSVYNTQNRSLADTRGTLTEHTTIEKSQWFSGAFTYYLPDSGEFKKIRRMVNDAEKLVGLNPDVSDVWNLLPWSWLGDWFYDIGPILQNVSNAQAFSQVLQYGYMMEHTIVKYEYTLSGTKINGVIGEDITLTIHDEVKQRVPATPYGFGSLWDGFSPYQLSILAALGVTRGKSNAR